MHPSVAGTTEVFGRGSARVRRAWGATAVIGLALAAWAAAHGPTTTPPTAPIKAMTAECHQAYRGYMEATDADEADFWAESWMAFGCESGGYWA